MSNFLFFFYFWEFLLCMQWNIILSIPSFPLQPHQTSPQIHGFFFPFLDNSLNLVSVANLWISVQPGTRECKIIHCHIIYKEWLSYPQQLPIANSFSVWSRSWIWSISSVPGFCLSCSWVGNHSCCDGHAMLRRQHFTAIPCPSSTSNHFFLSPFLGYSLSFGVGGGGRWDSQRCCVRSWAHGFLFNFLLSVTHLSTDGCPQWKKLD